MHPMTLSLICDPGMYCFHFSNAACTWVVARRIHMALSSSLSMCGIQCAQTFHFPKQLVRIWYTLAGEIPTSVATAMHEMMMMMMMMMILLLLLLI
jgi:hypothetical protein